MQSAADKCGNHYYVMSFRHVYIHLYTPQPGMLWLSADNWLCSPGQWLSYELHTSWMSSFSKVARVRCGCNIMQDSSHQYGWSGFNLTTFFVNFFSYHHSRQVANSPIAKLKLSSQLIFNLLGHHAFTTQFKVAVVYSWRCILCNIQPTNIIQLTYNSLMCINSKL